MHEYEEIGLGLLANDLASAPTYGRTLLDAHEF
jgi:hypothetical protein